VWQNFIFTVTVKKNEAHCWLYIGVEKAVLVDHTFLFKVYPSLVISLLRRTSCCITRLNSTEFFIHSTDKAFQIPVIPWRLPHKFKRKFLFFSKLIISQECVFLRCAMRRDTCQKFFRYNKICVTSAIEHLKLTGIFKTWTFVYCQWMNMKEFVLDINWSLKSFATPFMRSVTILHLKCWCSVSFCGCMGVHVICLYVPYCFFPPHKATLLMVIDIFLKSCYVLLFWCYCVLGLKFYSCN
jgi:hypothetical protein